MPYVYTVEVHVSRGKSIFKKNIGTHRFTDVEFANPVHEGDLLSLRPGSPNDNIGYDGPIDLGTVVWIHHAGRAEEKYPMRSIITAECNYPLTWRWDTKHHSNLLGLLEKKLKGVSVDAHAESV